MSVTMHPVPVELWNRQLTHLPHPHLLQSQEWAEVKEPLGWKPLYRIWQVEEANALPRAAALILQRSLPIGGFAARLSVLYVPKGPLMDWNDADLRVQVLHDLKALAKRQGAIFVKIDPDVVLGIGIPGAVEGQETSLGKIIQSEMKQEGWRFSNDQVQFRNTVILDLSAAEEEMLARMKQKTRYNIRLAQRRGVAVRQGSLADLDLLYHMYAETSVRDGFVIREHGYYRSLWETFMKAGMAEPLIAEVEGKPVAALVLFWFGDRAWYLHGMSRLAHREKMPNYLLQWEAMRRAKLHGCSSYDLWGAPDVFDESDSMWGVYRFKEGLGGTVVRTLGAWDLPIRPILYRLYTQTLPHLLDRMRNRGQTRTRHLVDHTHPPVSQDS